MALCLRLFSLTLLLGGCHGTGDVESGDGWAGIFSVPSGTTTLTWRMQKVGSWMGSAYAKPSMKMVIIPTKNCTMASLHSIEATGWPAHKISTDCTTRKNGNKITPDFSACFNLVADTTASTSLFKIDVTDTKCIAVFTDHDPEKFKNDRHYLDAERITDEL